ncbi:antibiotic biosynthesis monooxygenase [Paraburkholderia bengalensis]|uniref:Antibiotic biosynthesis monooxygenase n=1 Tax=Paraburkholderia bengalensis TaxID=2747562 RepID=A0ABU8J2V9_9BURK
MSEPSPNSTRQPDETFWRIEVEILPGKLEEFRALVRELIVSSRQEPGTLDYDWYFNANDTICHTYERYRNSEAVIAHATTFGATFAERFSQACRQIGLDVYGSPNEKATAILDAYNPRYFALRDGFHNSI